jgi:hypothetical protein
MALSTSVNQFVALNDSIVFATANVSFVSLKEIESNITPKGVIVTNTGTVIVLGVPSTSFTVTGSYGEDIAPNDEYIVRTETGQFITYNNYNDLINANYKHLIKFSPDASHDKTFRYTFLVESVLTTYDQKVYLDPSRHYTRLKQLVNKEAPNAGSS